MKDAIMCPICDLVFDWGNKPLDKNQRFNLTKDMIQHFMKKHKDKELTAAILTILLKPRGKEL